MIGLIPPVEHQDIYYRHNPALTTVGAQSSEPPLNWGRNTASRERTAGYGLAAETGHDPYELQRRLGHQSQRYYVAN
ncbi:hypothetical protein [Cryobacterium sp. TMS1-13-1]|uniref:hypothetical protein n=1 Tax=Cryobacterium sp. TMS1-13-1 TaxID=1259220 RepID=UPI00106964FC|nr:hypothetical protein [Cryobacterium sp. TMS1-13-1]